MGRGRAPNGIGHLMIIWIGNAYVAVAEKNWNICIYSLLIYTGIYNINLIGTLRKSNVCCVDEDKNISCEILGKLNNTPSTGYCHLTKVLFIKPQTHK